MTNRRSRAPDRPNADRRDASAAPEMEAEERAARLAGLKAQIRRGAYRPDVQDLARTLADMMVDKP